MTTPGGAPKRKDARTERIEGLRRRGEFERETLAQEVFGLRAALDEKRARWKTAGWVAGGLAAAFTVGRKFFGRNSLSAKAGRIANAASILFGLGKAVGRARKFW